MAAVFRGRGKSGLHGDTAPDNVRRGRPQGKRHRKQTAATLGLAVRVKGCGKSAPLGRRRSRHGKPRREQDRIGATGNSDISRPVSGPSPGLVARGGKQLPSQRNGHRARGGKPDRAIQNPAYRPTGGSVGGGRSPRGASRSMTAPFRGPARSLFPPWLTVLLRRRPRQRSLNPDDA